MIKLSWQDVETRVDDFVESYEKEQADMLDHFRYVYGVPRGGIPVAIFISQRTGLVLLESLEGCDPVHVLVVDDIVDSGETRKRYMDYSFMSVFDKQKEGNEWVEFPWERMGKESPAEDSVIRMLQYIGVSFNDRMIQKILRILNSIKEEISK